MTDAYQLPLPLNLPDESSIGAVVSIARSAVDLNRRPGYAAFTTGTVAIRRADEERIVIETDGPWAASAIRRALLDAQCAVDGDPTNEECAVTVWPTALSDDTTLPKLALAEERDEHGRTTVFLDGPHGTVEQQCGNGGHNDLIIHARHPFPAAVRTRCVRHGDCWMRSERWSPDVRPRSHIRTVVSGTGYSWDVTPEAGQAMRGLYVEHVHRTRPEGGLGAYRVALPDEVANGPKAGTDPATDHSKVAPAGRAPRITNAIRDLAGYKPAA